MACVETCCALISGDVSIAKNPDPCAIPVQVREPLFSIGDVSEFTLSPSTTTIERTSSGLNRGTLCSVERLDKVEGTITASCFTAKLLKIAMQASGEASNVAASTVVNEIVAPNLVKKGAYVTLQKSTGKNFVVTSDSATPVIFAEGLDYEIRNGELFILESFTGAAGVGLQVDYVTTVASRLELFTTLPSFYEIFVNAVNQVNEKKVKLRLYNVKLTIDGGLNMLSVNDFAEIKFKFTAYEDSSRSLVPLLPGLAASKYGYLDIEA